MLCLNQIGPVLDQVNTTNSNSFYPFLHFQKNQAKEITNGRQLIWNLLVLPQNHHQTPKLFCAKMIISNRRQLMTVRYGRRFQNQHVKENHMILAEQEVINARTYCAHICILKVTMFQNKFMNNKQKSAPNSFFDQYFIKEVINDNFFCMQHLHVLSIKQYLIMGEMRIIYLDTLIISSMFYFCLKNEHVI